MRTEEPCPEAHMLFRASTLNTSELSFNTGKHLALEFYLTATPKQTLIL